MYGISTVWEDTDGSANQYRCALYVYLMTVLSSPYGVIIYCVINAPGRGNNVVDGLNAMVKRYLKGEIEIISKLASKNTTNIGMLPSASKDVSIKLSDQCLHILNHK